MNSNTATWGMTIIALSLIALVYALVNELLRSPTTTGPQSPLKGGKTQDTKTA